MKGTLPGEIKRKGIVVAPAFMEEGGILRGECNYIVETSQLDGDWRLEVQWIDYEHQGHHVRLPHQVVALILRQTDAIRAARRQERGQKAAATRKAKAERLIADAGL